MTRKKVPVLEDQPLAGMVMEWRLDGVVFFAMTTFEPFHRRTLRFRQCPETLSVKQKIKSFPGEMQREGRRL